jgi:hypothetical protein
MVKKRREYSDMKEEALDRTVWRARFGRGFGRIVRQSNKRMNECLVCIWTGLCCLMVTICTVCCHITGLDRPWGFQNVKASKLIVIHVGTNGFRKTRNLDCVMREVFAWVATAENKLPNCRLVVSGMLQLRDVLWRRIDSTLSVNQMRLRDFFEG